MTEEQQTNNPGVAGMVSIVGRPNVGKSTLLNKIVGEKVAIVSDVPQTTRNQVRGIYTDERGQIVFIDTPGLHKTRDRLDQFMSRAAYSTTGEVDGLIHLVDVGDMVGPEEEQLVERLATLRVPMVLGLNKVDVTDRYIPQYIELWERVKGQPVQEMTNFWLLPLCGQTGMNVEKLLEIVFSFLPPGPALYPLDTVCDVPQKMAIADIVREKLFAIMRNEVPHALAVVIEAMHRKPNNVLHIQALILVEKDSQKTIVIGKGGQVLKEIGSLARKELEELLEKKIFLEVFVKTRRNWRDDNDLLIEMGYQDL